ncbi:hypothetical protein Vretimale_3351 [Volvox reticuliferus]|uniref:Uncharacterized protein n=1 Tax=Volvox reticuliferus TaxID=1737510 RepID=A0A8J4G093_9CHLO|nr:hypothetical protein Vretimale_3351 [Volvox reticuliferus]
MAHALNIYRGQVGDIGRLALRVRSRIIIAHSGAGDVPSTSGRDLSCSGGPVGFGSLRKGFKPQPKRTQQAPPKAPTINGRDKADVLRDTQAEVALKTAQAQAAKAAAAAAAAQAGGAAATTDDIWADWRQVDSKVNKYPSQRLFTAVGSGGEDFRAAMVKCVEDVVGGPVAVDVRASSGGNYQSVRVGPVTVNSPDQVLEVFIKMRQDKRLKFHL